METWRLRWLIVLILMAVALGLDILAGALWQGWGGLVNFSSIAGFGLGFIGFAVTIYTLFETQRAAVEAQEQVRKATEEARDRIEAAARAAEQAVERAEEQTRQTLERVQDQWRALDQQALLYLVREVRRVALTGGWERAIFCCEECSTLAQRLSFASGYLRQEKDQLQAMADDLRRLTHYFRQTIAAGQQPTMTGEHDELLLRLEGLLDQAGARIHAEKMEVRHAAQQ